MSRRVRSAHVLHLMVLLVLATVYPITPCAAAPPGPPPAREATEDRPVDARTYLQGVEAVRAGRRDEAMRLLRKAYVDFPDSPYAPQAMFKVAELVYPISSWSQIGSASTAAVKEATDLLALLAQKYRSSREAPRALVKLGYLALEPANPKTDLDDACGHFSTAAQVYPDSDAADDAYFGSGMCESLRGLQARAADVFERLLDEQPASPLAPEAMYRLGVALSHLDDPNEAALALQAVRTRYPDSRLAVRALERITLIHRLRLLPTLSPTEPASGAAGGNGAAPGSGLYRLDETYGAAVAGRADAAGGIRGASDITIDPQGLAVVASPKTPGIFRLDTKGKIQDRIEHPGPEYVAAADGLAVYISGRDQIAVNSRHWAGPELKDGQGKTVSDFGPIAVDPAGRVYLLDRRANAVLIFDRGRRYAGIVFPTAGKEGRFVDVAMGEDGGVFVLDARARMVLELHEGKETGRISLQALGLQDPAALSVDGLGDLFVLDGRTNMVSVADPAGHKITTIVVPRAIESLLGEPSSVAVDAFGRVYLAGRRNGQVVRFR